MTTYRLLLVALLLTVPIWGCLPTEAGSSGGSHLDAPPDSASIRFRGKHPIKIVCTTGMVADIAKTIGGEHVLVTALMGAGVDPHLYKASPADVGHLNRADLILYSGLHLEGKLGELLERMSRQKLTVPIAEKIPQDKLLIDEHGSKDPHVWFDVALWSGAAAAARDALAEYDPKNASSYQLNAQAYLERLANLNQYALEQLEKIPKQQRVLVTAHDAFRYFGRAYDVDVRGIQGISTDSEAGIRDVRQLIDFLVDSRIKAVFVETSVSDQNIRSLLEGCAARGHTVVIGGSLYSDAMGRGGTVEGTYEGMIRHNVDTIVSALR